MITIAGRFQFTISTNGMTPHDFEIVVSQLFAVEAERNEEGGEDLIYTKRGEPEVEIKTGGMDLWQGDLYEMSGWLKDRVDLAIEKEYDWGDLRADAIEALEGEREDAAFRRTHAAGAM